MNKRSHAGPAAVKHITLPHDERGNDPADFMDEHEYPEMLAKAEREAQAKSQDPLPTVLASEVQQRPVSWLWPGVIARGKLVMIAGEPGLGKSQLTASLASIVSSGGSWPVSTEICDPGGALILSAEDDIADTIVPRLAAAGADLDRCRILKPDINPGDRLGALCDFRLDRDVPRLEAHLERQPASLVIIDPISAYLGQVNSHNNAEVRGLLAPLSELASRYRSAIVCITHLNKGGGDSAMARVTGSGAFVAAARAAYMVVKDDEDDSRRLFLPLKNNIGDDKLGYSFTVEPVTLDSGISTSRIQWADVFSEKSVDDVMAGNRGAGGELADACDWLCSELSGGPVHSSRIKTIAKQAMISEATLRRAKTKLGVKTYKERGNMQGQWSWCMPEDHPEAASSPKMLKNPEDAHPNTLSAFGEFEHLPPRTASGDTKARRSGVFNRRDEVLL